MKLVIIAAVAAGALLTPATAQRASPPDIADPVTIKVTRQQLLVIGQGLQELPAKLANPVLNDLQAQIIAADQAAEAAKKAALPDSPGKPVMDSPAKP